MYILKHLLPFEFADLKDALFSSFVMVIANFQYFPFNCQDNFLINAKAHCT